jgi:large subunit ribosomal protein L30
VSENQLHVRQVRSSIGTKPKHRGTLRSLGLGRIGKQNTLPDRPEIRGMIARVPHLITVEELDAAAAKAKAAAKAPAKKRSAGKKVADPVAAALATDKAAKSAPAEGEAPAEKPKAKKAPAKKKAAAKKSAE